MSRNQSQPTWWRLPHPRPRKPNKILLIASIIVLVVWLVCLLLIAMQAAG
jgi:hypothetical protein